MDAEAAIRASDGLFRSGDLIGAADLVSSFTGDLGPDLYLAAIQTAMVYFSNTPSDVVSMTLAAHLDHPRAIDLLGLAGFHQTSWTGSNDLSGPLNQCVTAGRGDFANPCWKADNRLHIGTIQQTQGYHDLASIYLQESYDMAADHPGVRASAARRLGIDASARGDEETAQRYFEESVSLRRSQEITIWLPFSLLSLAEAVGSRDREYSRRLSLEAVDTARLVGLRRSLALALHNAGKLNRDRSLVAESHELATAIQLIPLAETTHRLLDQMD